jgi:hypothetical protein
MILDLISVASVINDETKMVYGRYNDGTYDTSSAKPLNEMSGDWFKGLDFYDLMVVKELSFQTKHPLVNNKECVR